MYLRHTIRNDGKVHRYWRVVRSVRIGRRVIQQTVAQLGELDEQGRVQARALAHRLIGTPERARLFDDGSEQLTVPVRLKGIRIERPRQFGDVYLALALWRGTGLEGLCERLLPIGKERIAWSKMAAVLVAARFCEPSSELHIAEDWYRRTSLSDLLQLGDEEVNKDRLYRGLDHLLAYKTELEAHLSQRCGELFAIQNEVLLYGVTSTYFEGQAEANPQALRGYSRDHRPDCKQVCIALVVTFDGFRLQCDWRSLFSLFCRTISVSRARSMSGQNFASCFTVCSSVPNELATGLSASCLDSRSSGIDHQTEEDMSEAREVVDVSNFKTWKTIRLGLYKTADAYRKAMTDAGMNVFSWTQRILWHVATATEETDADLVVLSVAELGFKEGATYSGICARALELGLELCPAEVGPALRLAYKDQPLGEWLIIAMEAITDSADGRLLVFRVRHGNRGRLWWLGANPGHPHYFWTFEDRFVFVRRK